LLKAAAGVGKLSRVRRELGEIVNAQRPLQPGDAIDHRFEAVLAELAMLVVRSEQNIFS
jgi:hypothetical protein